MDWFTIIETAIWVVGAATALRASYHYGRASAFLDYTVATSKTAAVLEDMSFTIKRQNALILAQQVALKELRKELDDLSNEAI